MKILIRNGRLVDPSQKIDAIGDLLVENDRISDIGSVEKRDGAEVIDATGLIVAPGFIDMHVHLREPGREDEETIESGAKAAVHGGFTSVACMPNTQPPIEGDEGVKFVLGKSESAGAARVYPIAAASKGLEGKVLSEIGSAIRAGAVGVSDDGFPIGDARLMRRVMEYVSMFGKPVMSHCEDRSLSANGVMNEGPTSILLGLKGIPSESEAIMISRDLMLANLTKAWLHVCHVSTSKGMDLIADAKRRNPRITCEVTPHHLVLTEEELSSYDTNLKVNPPLRSKMDVADLRRALKQGFVDAIASDHAPHSPEEKDQEFDLAPFGIIGLETAFGVVCTHLYHEGVISIDMLVRLLSVNPARILGIEGGTLRQGSRADITIFDPMLEWWVDPSLFYSKSRNTPFSGWKLKGAVVTVLVEGRILMRDREMIQWRKVDG